MKLTQTRESLLESLQTTLGAIEKRHTSPILENVLINVRAGQVYWRGTDMELEITTRSPVIEAEEGDITIPARKLADICKALPTESLVTLSVVEEDKRVLVTCGRSRFELVTLPASEFPELDDIGETNSFTLPENELKTLLDSTAFAMANQDVRYYLNGMLLEMTAAHIRTVSTDGHRLSLCTHPYQPENFQGNTQVILPRKGVLELSKLLRSDSQIPITIQLSQNHLRAQVDQIRFTSKLVDGRYPDYQAAVPAQGHIQLELDRKEFKDMLSRVVILSNEKFRGVRLNLSNNTLRVQSNNPEQETAMDEIDVNYQGDEFNIGFNINYLQDAVSHLSSENLLLQLNSPDSSALVTDPADETRCNVIMPIRL